jgi:hypothetical protein
MQEFLNARQNYPLVKGTQSNLFKCFITVAWSIGARSGVQAFLHPEGVYDDPNGGVLRAELYPRLRFHFQFQNQLMLFPVAHRERYSVNVYGPAGPIHIRHISNLVHPSTVAATLGHSGAGIVPGIKTDDGEWATAGHHHRLIEVNESALALFARLYDPPGTRAVQACLPNLHAQELVGILEKFALFRSRLGDLEASCATSEMWHETNAVDDGTIRRETRYPASPTEWVLSGPHLEVACPFAKTPREVCSEKSDYDVIDLTTIKDTYLPRTNYIPACAPEEYLRRTLRVPWGSELPITEFYRLAFRAMLSQGRERTLIGAIVPPACGHIHGVQTTAFKEIDQLLAATLFSSSLVADFFIKSTGRSNLHYTWKMFPLLPLSPESVVRLMVLNCLTTHYAALWERAFTPQFARQHWTAADSRLKPSRFSTLGPSWTWDTPLRTNFERRQALLELDVIVGRALGLTVEDLILMYRVQFPVLSQNDRATYYDRRGRIVYLLGDRAYGLSTPEWKKLDPTQPSIIFTKEKGLEYEGPFDCPDREADYRTAWEFFDREAQE